jgi:hypothetical protein
MAFEVYMKPTYNRGSLIPPRDVSIAKNNITFGTDLFPKISSNETYIEVLIDKEGKRVGFKEGTEYTGFRLVRESKKGAVSPRIQVPHLCKRLQQGRYPTIREGNIFVISNIDIAIEPERLRKVRENEKPIFA